VLWVTLMTSLIFSGSSFTLPARYRVVAAISYKHMQTCVFLLLKQCFQKHLHL
jgi:hypothetical protein